MLYPYLDHLENQLVAGCDNAMVFWRKVRERAFPGSARHVRSWLTKRQSTVSKVTPYDWSAMSR